MANGHYRVTDEIQQTPPLVGTEIYINKDFVTQHNQWIPVNTFVSQTAPEMYNNSAPAYPPPGYDTAYQYQYGANYAYQGYGYQNQQPAPPGDAYQQSGWTQLPTGPTYPQQPAQNTSNNEPTIQVVQEIQQQKATLTKQREDYVKKAMVLRRELDQLKQQKQDLGSNDRSEKEHRSVLKENDRLQDEINGKLKAILNVVEMLSTIIKDGKKLSDLETELTQQETVKELINRSPATPPPVYAPAPNRDVTRSPSKARSEKDRQEKHDKELDKKERYCYVYYDTGMHWCRACDKFPETAKEFLQHLHSDQHQDRAKENEVDTTPWHKLPVEPLLPTFEDAPKKRIPIKGLQFFISAPSWYCKLCDVWIGDLHCASHHLKSQAHFQNYENFVTQNPHWETEWLKDRERAMSRNGKKNADSSDSDKEQKKKKRRRRRSSESLLKEKKKKKRSKRKKKESSDSSSSSSSSSSDSSSEDDDDDDDKTDRGKSIRVAMRNMQQVKSIMDEDMSKWSVLEKLMQDVRKMEGERKEKEKSRDPEDEIINQWMTVVNPVPEKDKNLLDSLKDRMRAKQDIEKAKMAELDRRRREKEREEQEMSERKRRQAREDAERAEKERKRKEMELNKVLDKDRSHVKFRAAREHFRRRRSSEEEEDKQRERREKSHHRESRERSPYFRPRNASQKHSSPEPQPKEPEDQTKKKPPGPPSYKKLPFIGRMPLFKKKMEQKATKGEEISKEEYEPSRKTRFESGNLTKAYIPKPEVVCFPMLSTIPPMAAPPEPTAVEQVAPPAPPIIHEPDPKYLRAPAPPKIVEKVPAPPSPPKYVENHNNGPHVDATYYQMYQMGQMNDVPHPPLEPPPLPPDDDLALLGICADDMAAQSF